MIMFLLSVILSLLDPFVYESLSEQVVFAPNLIGFS